MSDTDLQIALMEAGRMNLMHLPPGAIAWLWDRPKKQIDAAEDLAVAANAYGNPVVDASLLKADQNIMLIKCEGGECFRIYPDGGFSYEDTPMDIGGCSSVLQGMGGDCGCPMDEIGHMADLEEVPDPSPMDGYNDAMDSGMLMADAGNEEHMNDVDPHAEVQDPAGLTNMAGEPTQQERDFGEEIASIIKSSCDDVEEGVGEVDGPGVGDGMGTGSPYVGDMGFGSQEMDNLLSARELGEFRIRDLPTEEVDALAEQLGIDDIDIVEDDDPCWKDYERVGTKKKNGKKVPNCVPKKS